MGRKAKVARDDDHPYSDKPGRSVIDQRSAEELIRWVRERRRVAPWRE